MAEPRISTTLFQKEIRQNAVVYIMPFLFLTLLVVLKITVPQLIPPSFAPILTIAIPAALALAYGVQAFDLEERGLTRDFLLVKPLTVSQIIGTKFSAGLLFLLIHSFLWKIFLAPQMVQWPFIPTLQGFQFWAALCLETIIYCAAFISGAYVKGPAKIIVALCLGTVANLWFFAGWFACLSILMTQISFQFQLWPYLVIFLVTAGQLAAIVSALHFSTQFFLKNISWRTKKRKLIQYVILFLMLPLVIVGWERLSKPFIYTADSFTMLLKGEQAWFQAIQGVKQPGKNAYAVSDALGRLGLVDNALGSVPRLIYQNNTTTALKAQPLTNLQWSPDGNYISFCDRGIIKVYSLQTHQVKSIYPGNVSLWSADSRELFTGQVTGKYYFKTAQRSLAGTKIHFALHDINQSKPMAGFDLAAPNLALGWDSRFQKMIIFDQSWTIRIVNLLQQNALEISVPKPASSSGKIIFAKMIPALQEHLFMIQIYHATPLQLKQDRYDIFLYLFDAAANRVRYLAGFNGLTDLIAAPLESTILTAGVRGVYRRTTFTREDK